MGDRGNVRLLEHAGSDAGVSEIFLYAHWGGSYVARTVQCALLRGHDRWDDEPYLGRIIFNEMTAGAEMETTSFGLSTYLTDNEHEIVTVDSATQTVSIGEPDAPPRVTYSFADFAKLDLVAAQLVPDGSPCANATTGAGSATAPSSPAPPPASRLWTIRGWLGFAIMIVLWARARASARVR